MKETEKRIKDLKQMCENWVKPANNHPHRKESYDHYIHHLTRWSHEIFDGLTEELATLRAENEELTKACSILKAAEAWTKDRHKMALIQAENKRLRSALEEIKSKRSGKTHKCGVCREVCEVATKALNVGGDEG